MSNDRCNVFSQTEASMSGNLDVPTIQDIPGFALLDATVDEPGWLSVQVHGTRLFVRAVIDRMLLGPIEASLFGVPIMLRRFVILNDGLPEVVAMGGALRPAVVKTLAVFRSLPKVIRCSSQVLGRPLRWSTA